MAPRRLLLQSLYLEPTQAAKLDELAARLDKPKAELLRVAVDDMLARHRMTETLTVRIIRDALSKSVECIRKLSSLTRNQATWHQKCHEAESAINDALTEVGSK